MTNEAISPFHVDVLKELGNMLSGAYLTALSNFIQLSIQPSVPTLSVDMVGTVMGFGLVELSTYIDKVIVIDPEMIGKGEGRMGAIPGNVFLLSDPPSYQTIFRALGV